MENLKTANQIKSEFETLASGHFQIHSFLYAQEFEQQAYENLIYPLMLVYPLGGNLSGTTYSRNYRVIIADRVLKSEGNELEVESDTQLIALDVLAYWMKLGQNERFSITSSNTITPFWEKWGDEVTGHFVDIGIEEFYDFNSCAIPLSGSIPSPTNPCKDARILINSVIYGNAPSNSNFNVVVKDQLGALVGSLIGGEWIVNTGGGSCPDANYTIEDSLGNVLYTGTIPSGGSATEVIGNSTLNVNNSVGTLISSRSILAEGTDFYNVGDSSAVLKDEDGNVLSTTPIKATETEDIVAPNGDVSVNSVAFDDVLSGGTLNIEVRKSTGNDLIGSKQGQYWRIGDSTAVIKDSANNTLKSEAIMATETENIVVNDSVAVIKNSVGTTLKSENILAEATENITINDSSVENSDASYSVDVLAEGSLVLPDSQINVNGVDRGDVVSVKTIDVNLEDSVGDPVTPTSVGLVGNTLTIEVATGGGPTYMTATGGVETTDGDYKIHTFNSSGNFEVLTLGNDPIIDFMLVAGGGSGGKSTAGNSAGGGGAGGLIFVQDETIASIGIKPIVIGAGGAARTTYNNGFNGNNSTFLTYTAIGGGGGGTVNVGVANNGGSGGGGSFLVGAGSGTSGQGFAGGAYTGADAGCGGGGAGQAGFPAFSRVGGRGGIGRQTYLDGTETYYAGGGGGSPYATNAVGVGGVGGGGSGGRSGIPATDGAANTGGGGGGGYDVDGGAGGSGILIIRYKYQ
jgi:hypothetical protein